MFSGFLGCSGVVGGAGAGLFLGRFCLLAAYVLAWTPSRGDDSGEIGQFPAEFDRLGRHVCCGFDHFRANSDKSRAISRQVWSALERS